MNIFVGNLARDVTEQDLQDLFAAFGKVDTVSVIKDKFTGEVRGFGFVEMANRAEAMAAIAGLNGKQLKGHVQLTYEPSGFVYALDVPLASLTSSAV